MEKTNTALATDVGKVRCVTCELRKLECFCHQQTPCPSLAPCLTPEQARVLVERVVERCAEAALAVDPDEILSDGWTHMFVAAIRAVNPTTLIAEVKDE